MQFDFADVRVDVAAHQLFRGGRAVHLSPKAFELLALLLEARPAVRSKAEIHARLWPDTFVTESSVHALISEIRHAIGDTAHPPRWVRTVHRVGYAFADAAVAHHEAATVLPVVEAWLVGELMTVPLHRGENLLGRGGDVTTIAAPTISRRHARLVIDGAAWIEDLNSKNGTWVGDRPARERTTIVDGDVVRLGSVPFIFRLGGRADSTETRTRPLSA